MCTTPPSTVNEILMNVVLAHKIKRCARLNGMRINHPWIYLWLTVVLYIPFFYIAIETAFTGSLLEQWKIEKKNFCSNFLNCKWNFYFANKFGTLESNMKNKRIQRVMNKPSTHTIQWSLFFVFIFSQEVQYFWERVWSYKGTNTKFFI